MKDQDTQVLSRADAAYGKKSVLDRFWQDVAINHYPERADFDGSGDVYDTTSSLYSSEPILFRREFGNFLGSILRPKGRKWFSITPTDARLQNLVKVKAYLEPKADIMRGLLYSRRSNYNRSMVVGDNDYAAFGNAVGSVTDSADMQALLFRTWHLRDCAWLQNDDTVVDTMFRRVKISVRDLCRKQKTAGWTISQKVEQIRDKEPDRKISCLHVQMPLIDYDYTIKRPKFDWVGLYYDTENRECMAYKMIPEFEYYVDRWFMVDGSQYALSPCTICSLPDARSLQIMTWSILEAGEKAVEPPLIAMNEAIQGGVNVWAGAVTWVDKNYDEKTGEALRALELGGSPQFGEALRQTITGNLNAAWFLNKLFMPQTNEKTAYEAQRLHEEYLRSASPIIDPAEPERNGNHLDIVFKKSIRMGFWGNMKEEMPKELRGRETDFTYDNPMQDARNQESTFAYKTAMEINAIAREAAPEVVAQFNHDKAYRDAIMGVGNPDWLMSEDEAKEAVAQAKEDAETDKAAATVAAMAESQAKATPKAPPMGVAA